MADRCVCCDLPGAMCTSAVDRVSHPERDDPSEAYRHDVGARPDSRTAQFRSKCPSCWGPVHIGNQIFLSSARDEWVCVYCKENE